MSKIVYIPPARRKRRYKLWVGIRPAWRYPKGTIVEDRNGVRWMSWRPESYAEMDCAPCWAELLEDQ